MTPTSTPAAQLFDAEQLYNILMGAIEPDLCTDMLPILDDMYVDETETEHAARMERYASAIERFQLRVAEFAHAFKDTVWKMGDAAMNIAQESQKQEDVTQLKATEDSLELS